MTLTLKTKPFLRVKMKRSKNTLTTKRKEEKRKLKKRRQELLNPEEVVISKVKIRTKKTTLTPMTSLFFS